MGLNSWSPCCSTRGPWPKWSSNKPNMAFNKKLKISREHLLQGYRCGHTNHCQSCCKCDCTSHMMKHERRPGSLLQRMHQVPSYYMAIILYGHHHTYSKIASGSWVHIYTHSGHESHDHFDEGGHVVERECRYSITFRWVLRMDGWMDGWMDVFGHMAGPPYGPTRE